MLTFNYLPISTLPAPYDIVWSRFPDHHSIGEPGPKPRPAIVLNASTHDDGTGEVQLIYGTTNLKMHERRQDFFVANNADMDACGLYRATRFDLDQIAWIPWAEEWFSAVRDYSSPIIGSLTGHKVKLLQTALAYKAMR